MSVEVRPAAPDEAPLVAALLDEASAWLLERGIRQWPLPFPVDELRPAVERGEIHVGVVDGEPAATLTLQWEDLLFWGERPPDAAYVHKVVVRRAHAGRGLGGALIEWAEGQARARGRSFLRLDCLATQPRIRRYYEELGFRHVGYKDLPTWRAALYERRIA